MAILGGWTVEVPVSEENRKVLNTALAGIIGTSYDPLAVATQVVNGVNYIFIAKSTTATLPPSTGLVKIYVTATPAGARPKLVGIETII